MNTNGFLHPRFKLFLVVSVAMCAALVLVIKNTGPSISSVHFTKNSTNQIDTSRQVIEIEMTRPLETEPTFTIEPFAPHTISNNGRHVTILLTEGLIADTQYNAQLSGVQSSKSWVRYLSFKTNAASFMYLSRGGNFGVSDKIYKKEIGQKEVEVVSDSNITMFSQFQDKIFYVSSKEDEDSIYEVEKSKITRLNINGKQIVSLDAGASGLAFSTTLSPKQSSQEARIASNYLIYYYSYKTKELTTLTSLNSTEPLKGSELAFTPDNELLAVQSTDGTTLLSNPAANTKPIYLGEYDTIPHLKYDGSELMSRKQDGWFTYNPTSKTATPLPDTLAHFVEIQYINDGLFVGLSSYNPFTYDPVSRIGVYDEKGQSRALLVNEDAKKVILSELQVSLNRQYISVELSSTKSQYDNYASHAKPTDVRTTIYDMTGKKITSVKGHSLRWIR